jgi:two-component system, NtrC family, nitrogen regulation sensor histidine kinase NtrY
MLKILSKFSISKNILLILSVAAVFFVFITYTVINETADGLVPSTKEILILILIDMIIFLALIIVITRRIIKLRISKSGASTRLQLRMTMIFGTITAIPTIIIAIFSIMFFNMGIQSWFNDKVKTAINESAIVASSYLQEHRANIRTDILFLANDLDRQYYEFAGNYELLSNHLDLQKQVRSLSEATIVNREAINSNYQILMPFIAFADVTDMLAKADHGEVVVIPNKEGDSVKAIIKLQNYLDRYLIAGRFVDNKVLQHITKTTGAVDEYQKLENNISAMQITFSVIFAVVAMILTLAAIAVSLFYASKIVKPLENMADATEKIKSGNLEIRVNEQNSNDEIGILAKAFNQMVEKLAKNRHELIEAYYKLDNRRNFIETVLSGVSSGIIVINRDNHITLMNKPAELLLNLDDVISNNISDIFPEILESINYSWDLLQTMSKEITIIRKNKKIILLVRIDFEQTQLQTEGMIITFDDITKILQAQKTAAWSDVARRIAHEIKNPLTPIFLAIERLRKKYSVEVSDESNFNRYTDTILRHVQEITRMVDEFVNFARMPTPVLAKENICKLIDESIFSQQCANSDINYHKNYKDEAIYIACDHSQFSRAIQNLLKNASEILENKSEEKNIFITIEKRVNNCHINIEDNGDGFPPELIEKLAEPYVTTRKNGTGLGLAIVKKIVEDHGGIMELYNNSNGGAGIEVIIPLYNFS